jgi:hypothetical protein
MNIQHYPLFDTKKVIKHYQEKDQVPITYICTTDLNASDRPVDIFYRQTPHPEFGNRYFGMFINFNHGGVMICAADQVEGLEFGMIDVDGKYYYSQSHHDYKVVGEKMIDGGREYIRTSGSVDVFKIQDGKFVKHEYAPE